MADRQIGLPTLEWKTTIGSSLCSKERGEERGKEERMVVVEEVEREEGM